MEAHSGHRGKYKNARHKQCVKSNKPYLIKRGTMNWKLKSVAAIALAASAIGSFAYATDPTPVSDATPPKKHKAAAAKKADAPCCAATEDQIKQLRQDLQSQIDGLKSDLAAKDAALRDAQQKAADAQASRSEEHTSAAGVADNAEPL